MEKRLVYNMRLWGCQETGPPPFDAATSRNPQISNQFQAVLGLTVSKTGTYTDRVTSQRLMAVVFLVSSATALRPAPLAAQAQQRAMYVSVLKADTGAPVAGLGPSDFIIHEDAATREVLKVAPAGEPMQIAVLVDNSQAASDDIQQMRAGLHAFVATMTTPLASGRKNELAILTLADRPTIVTDYTTDRAALDKGVDRIFSMPQSGMLLLDGLIEASKGLTKRGADRPVIVALTTEGREFSSRHYDQVLEPLHDARAAFHAIVVGPPATGAADWVKNLGMVLDQGTRESGGRRDNVLSSLAVPKSLASLADELQHQYLVTYARPESLIPPEHVTVSVKGAGLVARGTPVPQRQP